MKRIEFLEDVKDGTNQYHKGDIITHSRGQYFQDLGWAKCAKTGDTGKRKTGVSKIKPDDVIQPVA